MPDWPTIRADYEQGISQNSLAIKHHISQQAISKRVRKEGWITRLVVPPTTSYNIQQPADEQSELAIVEKALRHLATFLDGDGLETLHSHKLFADALSQYIKLKMILPSEQGQQETPYDMREFLSSCTDEELSIVRSILAAVADRKQLEEEKIRPIRKIG